MKTTLFTFLFVACMPMAMSAEEVDGINYSFNKENKTAEVTQTHYQGDMVIPETVSFEGTEYTVNSIGSSAFANNDDLTSVTIGKGVKTIGTKAFAGCPRMASLTLSQGLEAIGDSAFWVCGNLKKVTIPNSVTSIGTETFAECQKLEDIFVGSGKKSIGKRAFASCPKLKSVTLMGSEVNYGDEAFVGDMSLATVRLNSAEPAAISNNPFPNRTNATLIVPENSLNAYKTADYWKYFNNFKSSSHDVCGQCGDNAFWEYDSFNYTLTVFGSGPMTDSKEYEESEYSYLKSKINTIIIEDGITHIGDYAFYYFSRNMNTVILGNDVKSIGKHAFENNQGLTSIHLKREAIGAEAFSHAVSSENAVIPDNVTKIGESAFGGCRSLTSIVLSKNITRIENDLFYGCKKLTSIVIPEGVTFIGESAFMECENLSSIVIPESVKHICEGAFMTTGLSSITFPKNVTYIECNVIGGDKIKSVTLMSNPEIEENAFYYIHNTEKPCLLTVPDGFDFGGVDTTGKYFEWKGGFFKLAPSVNVNQNANAIGFDDNVSGLSDIEVNTGNEDVWYSLNGHRFDSKPTQQGVYIVNGKKVMIK